MTGEVPIADFIRDEQLLGRWFSGPSWENWFTILKGAFAQSLNEAEFARFVEIAERDPPARRCRELWLAIGRRGGKDSIASAIATYFAGQLTLYLICDRASERRYFVWRVTGIRRLSSSAILRRTLSWYRC